MTFQYCDQRELTNSSFKEASLKDSEVKFVDYRPEYGLEIVKPWRQSFQRAIGLEEHKHFEELAGQPNYFSSIEAQNILVAIDNSSRTTRNQSLRKAWSSIPFRKMFEPRHSMNAMVLVKVNEVLQIF
jgi:hypothetical protein